MATFTHKISPISAGVYGSCCCTTPMDLVTTKSLVGPVPVLGSPGADTQSYLITVDNSVGVADGFVLQDTYAPASHVTPIDPVTLTYSGGAAGPATVTWAALAAGVVIPTMPVGGHIEATGSLQFNAVGAFTNTAEAIPSSAHTDDNPSDNTASTVTNPVGLSANLVISKSATPTSVFEGYGGAWSITLVNNGPDPAHNTVITDALPSGLTYGTVSLYYAGGAAGPATTTAAGLAAGVTVPTLPNGGSVALVIPYANATLGTKSNTAVATPSSIVLDPNTVDNTSTAVVDVLPAPPEVDIVVNKTVLIPNAAPGVDNYYEITVTNNGPDAADGTVIQDTVDWTLPNAFTGVGVLNNPTPITYSGGASGPATWPVGFGGPVPPNAMFSPLTIPTLPAGGSLTFKIEFRYTLAAPAARVYTNTVVASPPSGVVELNPNNNAKAITHGVGASPPSPPAPLPGGLCPVNTSSTQADPYLGLPTSETLFRVTPGGFLGSVQLGSLQILSQVALLEDPDCYEVSNGARVDVVIATSTGTYSTTATVSSPIASAEYTVPTQAQLTALGFGTAGSTIRFTFRACFGCLDGGKGTTTQEIVLTLVP